VAAITTDAVRTGRGGFLPVAVVVALVGFISSAVVARFIERRGA
jgi:multisubunit Na+/H+ antiporter MnhF subunit